MINRLLLITREVEVPIVPQFLVPVPLNDILGKLELSSVPVPRIERNCEELRSWISDPPLPANHSLSTTSCSRRILGVGCMGAMLDNMRTRHQDQISHLQPARLRRDAVRWQWNRNWQLPRWDYGNWRQSVAKYLKQHILRAVEGEWEPWDAWGACTTSCDTGSRTRTRVFNGGQPCTGSSSETGNCESESFNNIIIVKM